MSASPFRPSSLKSLFLEFPSSFTLFYFQQFFLCTAHLSWWLTAFQHLCFPTRSRQLSGKKVSRLLL
ncbi:hypothetical protein ACN38_g6201 [Penicillium nordicum]|uniref:Uncharacterized protein n=1 Tax=Penicillium nordicum TaxID=229535 RepID=A0A0M9WFG3_9EURO|nr:hypothetical protein ACN38_g6201 [Penicillium nordicum]